ncbi:MAG: hypothetical protein KDG50_02190 [Chromatiales bacterium]|nr:hypothetical protein [Chromatiales bacterium]
MDIHDPYTIAAIALLAVIFGGVWIVVWLIAGWLWAALACLAVFFLLGVLSVSGYSRGGGFLDNTGWID